MVAPDRSWLPGLDVAVHISSICLRWPLLVSLSLQIAFPWLEISAIGQCLCLQLRAAIMIVLGERIAQGATNY
jgi:hypothetical protein